MSAARRLARALEASAAAAGCVVRVTSVRERPWSSATFIGAQHALVVEGAGAAEWLAGVSAAALDVPGHVVAELIVEGHTIEGLLLEN